MHLGASSFQPGDLPAALRFATHVAVQCAPHDVEEARAAALLGFVEAGARHDPARGLQIGRAHV